MASDLTKLYAERPDGMWNAAYPKTPKYYSPKAYEDKLAILVCQIKIWQPEGTKWFDIPDADQCLTIRECESIEIADSAKNLVNKAVVRFPRGTVISLSSKKGNKVNCGDKSDKTESTETLKDANNDGDVLTKPSAQYSENGVSTTSMAVGYDNKGLVSFNRTVKEPALLSPNDVAIGNRIEIRLGYAYSESEFNKMNSADSAPELDVAFTGFITSISVDTPLELECTNMAHVLACVGTPNIPATTSLTVKDFLDDDGEYHLLKDTGIPLAEYCKKSEITVSGSTISENLTVAEVLEAWNDSGIACLIETKQDGTVQLRVGLKYDTGDNNENFSAQNKKYITYNGGSKPVRLIQFDWNVAEDKLGLKNCDKKYLAVEAHGAYAEKDHDKQVTKFFKLTVRKDPDTDELSEFQVVNTREMKGKKCMKNKDGTESDKRIQGHLNDRVSLNNYNVVTYHSTTKNVTKEQLIEEAKRYWANYVPNGISGSIVIFGDLLVQPTNIVALVDVRQPEKNGFYYVESVNTTFGVNGYRRELTIPFKIANFSQPVQMI